MMILIYFVELALPFHELEILFMIDFLRFGQLLLSHQLFELLALGPLSLLYLVDCALVGYPYLFLPFLLQLE